MWCSLNSVSMWNVLHTGITCWNWSEVTSFKDSQPHTPPTMCFETLRAFGFEENLLSWVQLLYTGCTYMIMIECGLSWTSQETSQEESNRCVPYLVIYIVVIDPLLAYLWRRIASFHVLGMLQESGIGKSFIQGSSNLPQGFFSNSYLGPEWSPMGKQRDSAVGQRGAERG